MINKSRCSHKKNSRGAKQFCTVFIMFALVIVGILLGGNLFKGQTVQAANAYEIVVQYKSIEVSEGDTLWDIAEEYGDYQDKESYIVEIKELNHMDDDTIYSGSYLVIPYAETVPAL